VVRILAKIIEDLQYLQNSFGNIKLMTWSNVIIKGEKIIDDLDYKIKVIKDVGLILSSEKNASWMTKRKA